MARGIKTTEFWVVAIVLATWALRYLGYDLTTDQVAGGAVEVARQLHRLSPDSSGIWLAAIYAAGRSLVKMRQP